MLLTVGTSVLERQFANGQGMALRTLLCFWRIKSQRNECDSNLSLSTELIT